jgi:ADP-ribose pyrophosphatase
VAIVAVDGDEAILVRQFRAALGGDLLEIPAGTLDKGGGETPLGCAIRELAEETGATAASMTHLTTYAVAPGVSDEMLHLYLATGLHFGPAAADGIEEQSMTIERMALADVPAAIEHGRLVDAKTILGLLLARAHLA